MPTNMKNVIADAFFQMVREKGIDKVTVKDLVETCHISRQTFYYHFQDIMDVVEWSARKGLQVALERSLHEETPDKVIRGFVAAAMDNHDVIRKLLQSQKREYIEKIFVENLQIYLMELIRRKAPNLPLRYEDAEIALQFCAYGLAGVLLDHCGREDADPDKIAGQILRLLQGKLVPMLETTEPGYK